MAEIDPLGSPAVNDIVGTLISFDKGSNVLITISPCLSLSST